MFRELSKNFLDLAEHLNGLKPANHYAVGMLFIKNVIIQCLIRILFCLVICDYIFIGISVKMAKWLSASLLKFCAL